ncbi:MAG TPA: hypothetical protein VFE36_08095 [Candidatus Baltobacteraceae bacterium]|nr:hypothetical protein [Candidatus Baltobacteraceae bacterium]
MPADVLVGTVEKLVSKMDEADLAAAFSHDLSTMPPEAGAAFVEAMFDAFRDRGESSEDAVEGAGTTIASIQAREDAALKAFVDYARGNAGLLRQATTIFVEQHPDFADALPAVLRSAIAERLTQVT